MSDGMHPRRCIAGRLTMIDTEWLWIARRARSSRNKQHSAVAVIMASLKNKHTRWSASAYGA